MTYFIVGGVILVVGLAVWSLVAMGAASDRDMERMMREETRKRELRNLKRQKRRTGTTMGGEA